MGSSGVPDLQIQLEHLAGDIFHIHGVEQWIILTSNEFDLQIPDLPPFQSLSVLYNGQTQEFICRTFGRCLEKGSFESLEQLAKFAHETFQRKSACIGSGDFPESLVFSQDCAKYISSNIPSNAFEIRCDSCQKDREKSKWPLKLRQKQDRINSEIPNFDPKVSPKEEWDVQSNDDQENLFDTEREDENDSDIDLFKPEVDIEVKPEASSVEVNEIFADIKDENNPTVSIFESNISVMPKRKRGRPPKKINPPKSKSSDTEDDDDYVPHKKTKKTKRNDRSQSESSETEIKDQLPRKKKAIQRIWPKISLNEPRPDGKFECEYCNHAVTTLSGKHSHKKLKHGWGRFACELCPSLYKVAQDFIRHMLDAHVGVSEITCPQCKQRVNFEGDEQVFEGHYSVCVRSYQVSQNAQRRDNRPERVQSTCETCGRSFNTLQRLKIHQRIHEGKGFVCKDCGFWASHKSILTSHMQKHEREQGTAMELVCHHCAFVCLGQSQYKDHIKRRHRPYQCTQCPEICHGKRMFNKHNSDVHGANRCDICAMCFSTSTTLHRHKRIHMEPSLKCQYCPKMFKSKKSLVEHERTHTGETPLKCQLCDYKSKTSAALSLHKKMKHNGGKGLRQSNDIEIDG